MNTPVVFNPKGVFFWGYLTGAAVCATIQYGPVCGIWCFVGLAIGAWVLG